MNVREKVSRNPVPLHVAQKLNSSLRQTYLMDTVGLGVAGGFGPGTIFEIELAPGGMENFSEASASHKQKAYDIGSLGIFVAVARIKQPDNLALL